MERRSRGPSASRAVGRRPPCNNSGRDLKRSVIADPLRVGLERVAPNLSCRHEIGPLHRRRTATPPFELAPIASCCRTHALLGGTKRRPFVHRVNHLTMMSPCAKATGHNASALILDELEYRPCLDGSPVAQRPGNVSTLRRGRNAFGAAVVSHRCRKNAAALSDGCGAVSLSP
jgi:hypothetical protein